jgi:hypothetical protein
MSISKPSHVEISTPDGPIELIIPDEIWKQIPEARKLNQQDLSDYLLDALRIGVLATVNASITIDTQRMEAVVEAGILDWNNKQTNALEELEDLFNDKLTGEKSDLALTLKNTLGDDGILANLLTNLQSSLTNPDLEGSIPASTRNELKNAAHQVKTDLDQALDITDEKTALGKFVRNQNNIVAQIHNIIDTEFSKINIALGVEEILKQKDEKIEELYQKGTTKGVHFENDAVDALQSVAQFFGDIIDHTGGEGVGNSRTKIGDIVITIISPGVPEIKVAIEAKAGSSIGHKELVRQTRDGVKSRGAVCGIGLMEQKHMRARQQVVMKEGENYIVGVDWDNMDFLPLEVIYRTIRIQLIADEMRSSGEDEIDVEALKKHLTEAQTDLGLFASMKGGASSAITTLETLRANLAIVETKVKNQLKSAEDLL